MVVRRVIRSLFRVTVWSHCPKSWRYGGVPTTDARSPCGMLRGCGEGRASAFCVVRLGRRSSTAAAGEATSCSVLDIDRYKTTLHFSLHFSLFHALFPPLYPSLSFFFIESAVEPQKTRNSKETIDHGDGLEWILKGSGYFSASEAYLEET